MFYRPAPHFLLKLATGDRIMTDCSMSWLKERFYVQDATPEGVDLLEGNDYLQAVLDWYIDVPEAPLLKFPGVREIGRGWYSRVYTFDEETALKVSSPVTSNETYAFGMPFLVEDLEEQFAVLSALRRHLFYESDDVITPEQHFVSRAPGNTYILAQEYMRGWIPLGLRMDEIYGSSPESYGVCKEITDWSDDFRRRINRSLGGFAWQHRMTDLERSNGRYHRGNLLVPMDMPLNGDTPLCIIDQPGIDG